MSGEVDKVFQQYRQSAVFYSATVITVTLAVSAALSLRGGQAATYLQRYPALRVGAAGLVFLILFMASAIQYKIFRGSYLHANHLLQSADPQPALWRKGNEAFSSADRLTRFTLVLFGIFLAFSTIVIALAA